MKRLKDLITEKLSVNELFSIKGGSNLSIKEACKDKACKALACNSNACTSNSCSTQTCNISGCNNSSCSGKSIATIDGID